MTKSSVHLIRTESDKECVTTVSDRVQPAIHYIVQYVLPYTARSVEAMARNVGQQIRNRER